MLAIFLNENQTLVRILYLVHIVTVIGAFGPLFLYPRLQRAGQSATVAGLHMKLVFPSLVILWVAGMGMAGINEFDLARTYWITITLLLWLAAVVVSWFMIRPALADTSDAARSKMAAGIGITHVILVVSLWLMIFKPFVDNVYVFTD
ncbi:MAG TPA: hypothetical protein VK860_17265 [Ilumatobacteraceae bacterium]|nr:hypothetical protein [Ilumatobacteraceae bacterium]